MSEEVEHSPRKPIKAEKALAVLRQKQLEQEFKLDDTPYTPVQNIGTGAYGVVCSAVDERTEKKVAIKKIPKAFGALTLIKRTLREIRILQHFRHENIVAIMDMFQATGTHGLAVYMVMDLMETDLHQIIHSKQTLTEQHLQYFLYQVMRGLKYMHSAGVIHRDLKPSNLLVNADCLLKIGDFGFARSLNQGPEGQSPLMTQYVATRWYRAPELLFSMLDYSAAVDIWSAGCIFAEMIMRRQLFPGRDQVGQLKLIIYYLGTPADEVMDKISSDLIKRIIVGMGPCQALPFETILPNATKNAIDLIAQMLPLAPWRRITAADALSHKYMALFHEPDCEPVCSKQVVIETDYVETLSADELKEALENEVGDFQIRLNGSMCNGNGESSDSTVAQNGTSDDHQAQEDDDDIIMLSAKFEYGASFNHKPTVKQNGHCPEPKTVPDSIKDTKTLLRHALQARAARAQQYNSICSYGAYDNQNGPVTAQGRHLERQERRKKRCERIADRERQTGTHFDEKLLSEQDQTLLERWNAMHRQSQQKRLEGQIGDIISETLPSPLSSELSAMSGVSPNQNLHNGEVIERRADNSRNMNSAQLMDTWLQATNMDPEELQDLEQEIRLSSP